MAKRVGLLVGREWSFPPAFIEAVNGRDEGVTAEFVKIGHTSMEEPIPYDVLIDRISHEVPYYRSYLKKAVLEGVPVVNNPFMWTADDKFFGASLITKLGISSPKTVALPNKEYVPGIVPAESLRNLVYPLDWDGLLEYVGLPCVLKDAHGGGWRDVYVCHSKEELLHHYDHSGLLTMVVQEFIEWEHFVRCICIGQEEILPIKYDPRERKYIVEHGHLTPELGKRIVDESRRIVQALGYDMNSIEWAIRDGVPYAIDFMNPAPDMDVNSLTHHYFDWVVDRMATMAIRLAKRPRKQASDLKWGGLFTAARASAAKARAEKVRDEIVEKAATKAKGAAAKARSSARKAAGKARDAADEAAGKARKPVKKAKGAAARVAEKAREVAREAEEEVREAADEVREAVTKARRSAVKAKEAVAEKAREAAGTARTAARRAVEAAREAADEVRERREESGPGDAPTPGDA